MPWAAAASVVGSVAGAAVSGAMAPSPSGGGSYYVPSDQPGVDTAWQNLYAQQQANQLGINQNLPYYQQSLQQGLGAQGQYAPGYQQAANVAGGQYGALGRQLQGAAARGVAPPQAPRGAGPAVFN